MDESKHIGKMKEKPGAQTITIKANIKITEIYKKALQKLVLKISKYIELPIGRKLVSAKFSKARVQLETLAELESLE